MIFRSHALNTSVDRAIRALKARLGAPYGVVFRLFLETGLAQLRHGTPLPDAINEGAMPLRAVHLRVATDEELRVLAFQLRLPRDELVARLLLLGLSTLDATMSRSATSEERKDAT
jgi:hypothetical protein